MTDLPTLDLDPEELDPIETASRDQITALQTRRMAWSLKHAYDNVPHYRAAFDTAGVHPDDFNSLADLRKFPFTSKQDLRDNDPFGMFAVPRHRVARLHASSGTTGKLKAVLDPRSFTIATYALCGFANLSSVAIQVGGIGALAPTRKSDLARMGMKAVACGTMANFMSACIAGMLV